MGNNTGCDSAGYLVYAAARLFIRSLDKELRKLNITAAQLAPMLLLSEHQWLVQRDLVRRSAVAQPAMVAMLRKLEQDGLVCRSGEVGDARTVRFSLTVAGKQTVRSATRILAQVNKRSLSMLNARENDFLIKGLRKMMESLSE